MLPALGKTGPFSPPWGGPRGGPPGPWEGGRGGTPHPPWDPPRGGGGDPPLGDRGAPDRPFYGLCGRRGNAQNDSEAKTLRRDCEILRFVPRDIVKERSMHSFLTETFSYTFSAFFSFSCFFGTGAPDSVFRSLISWKLHTFYTLSLLYKIIAMCRLG